MAYTFDGPNKVIVLDGSASLDVRDLYSRWKDWFSTGNAQYLPAFAVVGGEPIDAGAGIYVTGYFFLLNGWRIRPSEAHQSIVVENGVLLVDGGGDPFIATIGAYRVLVRYSQPIKSETIATGGGGGGGLTIDQDARLERIEKLLRNKQVTDPADGKLKVYDNDGTTLLLEGDLFEDAAATQPYRGQGAERRERLT